MLPNRFFHQFGPTKVKIRKFQIFHQNTGLTPLAKCKFCNFLILMFLKERLFLWQECRHKNWPKNVKVKKFHIFCPKPWTNPLGKRKFCNYTMSMFLYCRKAIFASGMSPKTSFWLIWLKKDKMKKFQIFDKKYELKYRKNANFST